MVILDSRFLDKPSDNVERRVNETRIMAQTEQEELMGERGDGFSLRECGGAILFHE
jgi:hypothetical protein